ncbi:hypothetical protein XBI1_1560020 [Xenorhabdus bovienii str. Intermedium]|uniref:Uncharacterized protein n=1 Tax=Xenorhabdus bovienii str. Intermedium TaxID=1379677 RepID=A0A077QEB9_XENBV|nr:hypothetical protein XBI1_1560020 [Xenorhabdus bovienii str. Intermedium]
MKLTTFLYYYLSRVLTVCQPYFEINLSTSNYCLVILVNMLKGFIRFWYK